MPHWTFLVVEVIAFLFGGLVLREAWQAGRRDFVTMLVGMGFGFAIEVFFVTQYAGYSYGDFLVDLPVLGHNVPLWVAVGWGTIIWISMRASDRIGLPWAVRPLLDGLLALSLDLTLDPVAEALGWWNWTRPGQAWGVPYDNFIGWMLIVASISFFVRLGYRWLKPSWLVDILIPIGALIPSVATVAGAQLALEKIYPHLGEPLTWLIVAFIFGGILFPFLQKAQFPAKNPWFLTVVPLSYHGLMLFLLLATPLVGQHPELILFMVTATLTSLTVFRHGVLNANAEA